MHSRIKLQDNSKVGIIADKMEDMSTAMNGV